MTTSVATAVEALRERLSESTASQWTDQQLRRWLDEACKDIARRTFHLQDTDSISVTAGDGQYTLDADVLRVNKVYWTPSSDTTRKMPLEPRQWEAMDNIWMDYQDDQGTDPYVFSLRGYAPNVVIQLYPVPGLDGTLQLHVVRMPASINVASGGGNLDIPDSWCDVAYDHAEYKALRKDRDPRWQEAKELYEQNLEVMISNGDYLNAPNEVVWDGVLAVPRWLADPNY